MSVDVPEVPLLPVVLGFFELITRCRCSHPRDRLRGYVFRAIATISDGPYITHARSSARAPINHGKPRLDLPVDKLATHAKAVQEIIEQPFGLGWSITTFLSWEHLDRIDPVLVESGLWVR